MDITLQGPDYGLVGQTVYFKLIGLDDPSKYTITWYKGGVILPLSPNETDPTILYLYDIDMPAIGLYHAIVNDGTNNYTTQTIDFEVGDEWRNPTVVISLARSLSTGPITLTAAWTVEPACCTSVASCTWYNPQGQIVSTSETLSIDKVTSSNSGVYTALVQLTQMGGYSATSETETITIGNATYKTLYIHDLRPGRDAGYIWMGWWVHDEIIKAQEDGFDWMADPTNSRFKYKAYLATLVQGFGIWADLDMQESRNGYILHKKDVIVSA